MIVTFVLHHCLTTLEEMLICDNDIILSEVLNLFKVSC